MPSSRNQPDERSREPQPVAVPLGDGERGLREVQGFIVSTGKSGSTWLRFMLAHYISRHFDLGLDVDPHSTALLLPPADAANDPRQPFMFHHRRDVPFLANTHDPYSEAFFRGRFVIFLARSPFDFCVSQYYHNTRSARIYQGSLSESIRLPKWGVSHFIRFMNLWAEALPKLPSHRLSYERMRADPEESLAATLRFIGLPADADDVASAAAASAFDRMRNLAIVRAPTPEIAERLTRDPSSGIMRRGVVGGFRDELSAVDIAYIRRRCAEELTAEAKTLLLGLDVNLEGD